jgi:Cof subfamily protein (haloacid dehalogenase superfamily)
MRLRLPRLIALDLDGTLLPESKQLTARSRAALHAMEELGTTITLATGKFLHLAGRYGEELGLRTPVVALDGARLGGQGCDVIESCIARDIAEEILERYADPSREGFIDDGADEVVVRADTEALPRVVELWAARTSHAADLRGHLRGDPAILALYGLRSEMEAMSSEISTRYPGLRVSLHDSVWVGKTRLALQPAATSKGSGLRHVLGLLGLAPEECMVFGDWHNDLHMFEVGGVNVAMANAVEEVKAEAAIVLELDCEEDGVACFLEQEFLSKGKLVRHPKGGPR